MTVPKTADVVVIGGGIVGAATARAIAFRGASVVLIEKESEPAREGSGRAQGSLRVQGRHASELPLALEALEMWKEAADEGDFEFVQGGNLYFQTTPEESSVLAHLVKEAHGAGLKEVELLTPDRVREIMPEATGPFLGAMWSPIDAQAQPDISTKYFARKAKDAGAMLCFGVKATRLYAVRGEIAAVETSAGTIATNRVVLAGGVWTPYLAHTVGVKVPLMPVVMSELETAAMPPIFSQTIRAFGFGARQRPNGRTVISAGLNAKVGHDVTLADFNGLKFWLPRAMSFRKALKLRLDLPRTLRQVARFSTLDTSLIPDTSPEPRVDKPLVDTSLTRMAKVIPAYQDAKIERRWAGLVDMTPDGLPIIDDSPGVDGLTIITGLAGHGLHLGPVLGEIGAELALNETKSRPIDHLSLARFSSGSVSKPEMMI